MINYKKTYLKALNYDISDFIPSELSGKRAIDIHHIVNRENRIENLMAVTREEHIEFGEIKSKMCYLLSEHWNFLKNRGVKCNDEWFEHYINKYSIYDN